MTQYIPEVIALALAAVWIAFGWKLKKKKVEPVKQFFDDLRTLQSKNIAQELQASEELIATPERVSELRLMVLKEKPGASLVANCTAPKINWELTRGMDRACNANLDLQFPAVTLVEYRVWLYNVSRLTHEIDNPILGHLKVPGNTSKKRYTMYTSLPQPLMLPRTSIDTGETTLHSTDARRVAMDIINPDNLSLDQTLDIKYNVHSAVGRDLGIRGMFWSLNNPPKKAEVDAAILRMEKHYKDLLEQAAYLYEAARISPYKLRQYMQKNLCSLEDAVVALNAQERFQATPEMHAAAEWFKVASPWHPVLS